MDIYFILEGCVLAKNGCQIRAHCCLKAAVHWVRVKALSAESSPKLTWDAMRLRGRTESARNPIAANVKFSD